jgi:hypothetical protein
MKVPDDDRQALEDLDEQRRRIYDEFNLLVQQIREGSVASDDRLRLLAQQLHVRHENVIRRMIDLLVY